MYKSHQKIGAIRKMANGGMIGTEQAYDRFANMQLDGFADVADGYADGGLIGAIKRKFMPSGEAQKQSPPDKPTMAPMVRGSLDPKNALREREEAAGLKAGGAIRGKGGPTSDDIPIMASNGEFMIKAKAVAKLGVPALEALNAIADKPGDKKPAKAGHGAVRKMATGGLILGDDGVYRVNSAGDVKVPGRQYGVTNPRAATPVSTLPAPQMPPDPGTIKVDPSGRATAPGQQYRLGGPATPTPGTALVTTGPGRSFTPPTIPNPQVEIPSNYTPPQVNSKTGAYTNVPPVAEPPPTAPQAPSRISAVGGAIRNAASKLSSFAGGLAAPLTLGATAGQAALTDTEDYAKRFGLENTQPGLARDIGIRALGAASDLGNTLALGLPKTFLYRDGGDATAAAPAAPVATPAVPNTNRQALQGAAPTAATPAPVDGQVIRIGNSYSGTDVSGDISLVNGKGTPIDGRGGTITAQNNLAAENLARKYGQTSGFGPQGAIRGGGTVSSIDTSAGYAADLKALAEINDQKAKQEANIQAQERYAQDNVLQQRALGGNRNAAAILQGRTQDRTTQRGQDIQAGASRESAQLARQKLGLETTAQGIENRGKEQTLAGQKQLADAQAEYLAAGDDPVKLKAAERKLAVLSGKTKDTQDEYAYAPGGQTVDPATGLAVTQPGVIYNKRTGQLANQNASPALPPGMVKQIGTSGGKPVYLDKNGKQVIAKG